MKVVPHDLNVWLSRMYLGDADGFSIMYYSDVQHLKAYASTVDLKNECVAPRFKYVARGCAEYVEWLEQKENPAGKGWAAGAGYGAKIITILNAIILWGFTWRNGTHFCK